jgi:chromosome segregation ATPase
MPYAVSEATQYRLETAEWEASLERSRQRRHEERAEQPPPQTMDAQTASWVEWVDARIEEKFNVVLDIVGEALGKLFDKQHENLQSALDRRDAAIQALRDEVEVKLSLGRKVARLKAEIAEARAMQPNFEDKLNVLEGRVEKVSKQTSRVRTEQSILEYQQKQLNTELSQMKRNAASPAAVVEFETSSSRITVGNLHPDAANALREFASQVIDAEDGGAILFSGSVGTA